MSFGQIEISVGKHAQQSSNSRAWQTWYAILINIFQAPIYYKRCPPIVRRFHWKLLIACDKGACTKEQMQFRAPHAHNVPLCIQQSIVGNMEWTWFEDVICLR